MSWAYVRNRRLEWQQAAGEHAMRVSFAARLPNDSNIFMRAPPALFFGADVSVGEGGLRPHRGHGFNATHAWADSSWI